MSTVSIVIPTILKPGVLETVKHALAVTKDTSVQIEVVINPLRAGSNEYLEIERKLVQNKKIIVRHHTKSHISAESSALYAAASSKSEWVWILGDEDLPTELSPQHLLQLAKSGLADFYLLNAEWKFHGEPIKFYEVGPKPVQVTNGENFFAKLGFVSITPALSCWFLRKSIIDLDIFERFHTKFEIYSHTFALASFLQGKKAGMTNSVCLTRQEGSALEISKSLAEVTGKKDAHVTSIWVEGLLALASQLSRETGEDLIRILKSREIEMFKVGKIEMQEDLRVFVSSTLSIIQRAIESRTKESEWDSEIFVLSEEISNYLSLSSSNLIFPTPVRIGF
jgi:hypothetical protein